MVQNHPILKDDWIEVDLPLLRLEGELLVGKGKGSSACSRKSRNVGLIIISCNKFENNF